uniref:Uncharacterized protein n=1 Tax=Caenorhabditis japonica TaxID=281687 RepID=A0A8R1EU87_CAEJA
MISKDLERHENEEDFNPGIPKNSLKERLLDFLEHSFGSLK